MHKSMLIARVAALAVLIGGALTVAVQAADASSIYACVRKHGGSVRIVSAKSKCRRGERRVSWNAAGPAGPPGANGATGATGASGANGVGVDYQSVNLGPTPLSQTEKGDIVVAKTIPAGTYFASGKSVIIATEAKATVSAGAVCELVDAANTPILVEAADALDIGEWGQQVAVSEPAVGTIEMQGQLTTTQPTTLAVVCNADEAVKEVTLDAVASEVSALQTTANK
jgi:hypothetical protein